jgi:hypothetical protein
MNKQGFWAASENYISYSNHEPLNFPAFLRSAASGPRTFALFFWGYRKVSWNVPIDETASSWSLGGDHNDFWDHAKPK